MNYAVNYDFGKHWDSKIKPHLDNSLLLKAIRRGINDYLSQFPNNHRYKKNTVPADYSSKDHYQILINIYDTYCKKQIEVEAIKAGLHQKVIVIGTDFWGKSENIIWVKDQNDIGYSVSK